MKHLTVAFSLCLFLLITVKPVVAQQAALELFPPVLEIATTTERTLEAAFLLENRGDPAIIRLEVVSFAPDGERGGVRFLPQRVGGVQFLIDEAPVEEVEPIFMKSREKKEIRLKIEIPAQTEEKDHYYTLIARTEPVQNPAQSSVLLSTGVGSHILLSVTDTGKLGARGRVSLFAIDKHISMPLYGRKVYLIDSLQDIPVTVKIENTGVYAIKPRGKVIVAGMFGDKSSYDIESRNILAKSQRLIEAAQPEGEQCGDSEECRGATVLLRGFLLGYYRAGTAIDFGEGTPTLSSSVTFIVFPFRLVGVLTVLLICILAARFLFRKKAHKPKLHNTSV